MRHRLSRVLPLLLGAAFPAAALAEPTAAAMRPTVTTSRACYRVGQRVTVTGAGFAASRAYDIAVDGVDFGQSETNREGGFTAELEPGGLAAGVTQAVDSLDATDGTADATTTFTVTRPTGALFTPSQGIPRRLGHFEAWAMGAGSTVYLHYVLRDFTRTVVLGRTTGACGALRSGPRHLFPFAPADGRWTLQLDTQPSYRPQPSGPVARLRLTVA